MDTVGIPRQGRVSRGLDVVGDSDLVVVVIDGSRKNISEGLRQTIAMLNKSQVEKWLLVNKVDRVTGKRQMKGMVAELSQLAVFTQTVYTCALDTTLFNVGSLKTRLLSHIAGKQYLHPWLYHSVLKTTSSPADLLEDHLRQTIFQHFYREIPFTLGVQLVEYVR